MVNKNRLKVQNEGLRSFENCPIKSELSQLIILNKKVILILFDLREKKKIQDRKRDEKIHFRVFVTRYFFKQSIRNTD